VPLIGARDAGPFRAGMATQLRDRADGPPQHAPEWRKVARGPVSQCRQEVIMNVHRLPGDLTVPSFGPPMGASNLRVADTIIIPTSSAAAPTHQRS
jgi:hypothetical protein